MVYRLAMTTASGTTHRFTTLKVALFERAVTFYEFARYVKINPARLSAIEEGFTRPTFDEAARLAKALDLTIDDLLAPVAEVELVPLQIEPAGETRHRQKDRLPR